MGFLDDIVERQDEWIGGVLQELESGFPETGFAETEIIGVEMADGVFFRVIGKDFSCGFDRKQGGGLGSGDKGWLTFYGYGGHKWRIKRPDKKGEAAG